TPTGSPAGGVRVCGLAGARRVPRCTGRARRPARPSGGFPASRVGPGRSRRCRGSPSRRPGVRPRPAGSGWSRLPPWATHPHVAALGPALVDAVVDAADLEVRVLGPQVAGGVAGLVGQDQPLALRVLPDLLGPF